MPPILNSKIVILFFVLIAGVAVLLFVSRETADKEMVPPQEEENNGEDATANEDRKGPTIFVAGKRVPYINNSTRESILADIESTKGEGYERYSIMADGSKDKIILAYQPSYSEESESGIMVIDLDEHGKPKVFWEVSSAMFYDSPFGPRVEVRDINNDGSNEILSWWPAGGKVEAEGLFMFTWDGSKYIPINPFGSMKVSVTDIDGDHIDEVILERNAEEIDGTDPDLGITVYVSLGLDRIVTTYKWNGEEYYLWKEERVTVPEE